MAQPECSLPGCGNTGGTSPSQGNQHSRGGEGGRAVPLLRHGVNTARAAAGMTQASIRLSSSKLPSCNNSLCEKPPAMGGQVL